MCVLQFGPLLRIPQRLDERRKQSHMDAGPRDQRLHFLPIATFEQLEQLHIDRTVGNQRAFNHRRANRCSLN